MTISRLPVRDEVTISDETVVMVGDRVTLLSPIAGAVWRFIAEPRDLDEVTASVVEQFGAPPEGEPSEAVASIVAELADAGLVRVEGPR